MGEILYSFVGKVIKVGNTYCVYIPSRIARAARIGGSRRLYVYAVGDTVVYSLEPPKEPYYFKIVKPRVISRTSDREYYVVTLPKQLLGTVCRDVRDCNVVIQLDSSGKIVVRGVGHGSRRNA